MNVIFMGTPDFAVGTLKSLINSAHQVKAVVTQPDKPKGRGKAMQATPVKEVAKEAGIPVLQPKRVREREVIEKLEKEEQISFCREQREAFGILEKGGIEILLGGPGTGKTTTINGIVKAYLSENPNKKVLLCAPTGMGAVRMREISGLPAYTIHKAIKLKWLGGRKTEPEPLPYELIVADEMSMCDTELFSLLLKSAASGTSVLLAGDYNQIPSVGPGQVLRDLAESGMCRVYRLSQMFRQREGGLIAENAREILKGGTLRLGKEFQITKVANDLEMIKALENMEPDVFSQVLSPVKKGVAGCNLTE